MTDPQAIAKGLSEAESEALRGRFAWASIYEAEAGEHRLFELGLWSRENLKARRKPITPLGLSVRKILEASNETL